jgi:hypothetical protein
VGNNKRTESEYNAIPLYTRIQSLLSVLQPFRHILTQKIAMAALIFKYQFYVDFHSMLYQTLATLNVKKKGTFR